MSTIPDGRQQWEKRNQPGGQDTPVSAGERENLDAPRRERIIPEDRQRSQGAERDGNDGDAGGGPRTELREVRAADPELSPETNAALTEELRDVVGSDRVEVPVDRPHASQGQFPDRQGAGAYLNQNRFQLIRATAIALTFGIIVALATGKWWLILVAVGIHAIGTVTVVLTVVRLTTQIEHPAPEVAAAMADDGVASPDERFSQMVEEFSQTERRGVTETVGPGNNERTTESEDDPATSAAQQSSAITPTAEPSESGGTGGAPDLLINTTAGALLILSIVLPFTSGGGWLWLLPAVMVPLLIGFVLFERIFATARGKGVAAERKQIAIIGVCVVIAAAVLAGVVAIAYNGGPNHGSSSSNTHGAVAPRVISA